MSWPPKSLCTARWRGEAPTGQGTIVRRYPRRCADGVEGDCVCRPFYLRGVVLGHHLRQLEVTSKGCRDGRADEAAGVLDHERHLLGGHVLGGDYQVAFIFAQGGVQDYDEIPAFWRRKRGESARGVFFLLCLRSRVERKRWWGLARRTEGFYRILHGIERQV